MITFITGNAGKFSEAQATLSGIDLAQQRLDLPEIQDLDPREVMRQKLLAAKAHGITPCIVEDSSLTFECLGNKLPGPFIKWFEETLGIDGLYALAERYGNDRATSSTLIGYLDEAGGEHYFEGSIQGRIVAPRGDKDFGYGPIFLPDGTERTFGEMEREEKYRVSSRGIAFRKLKEHLETS